MSVRQIVQAEILRSGINKGALGEPSKEIIDFDEALRELVADLRDTMWAYSFCVGLAAPQIGVNLRVAVINPTRESRDDDMVLVNPIVLSMTGKKDRKYESCMSAWGYQGTVERRSKVGLQYFTIAAESVETEFEGFPARVVLHEYDHLDGFLYLDRLVEGTERSEADLFGGPYAAPSDVPGEARSSAHDE